MSKKVTENFYKYDEREYVNPRKYTDPLFQSIDREMQSRTEDAQADFIMDLAFLRMGLPDGSHNQKVITNYILNYLIPLDADGDLRKDAFESRMKKMEERKLERIYIPEGQFSFEHKGKHSDEWIAQSLGSKKMAMMERALLNIMFEQRDQDDKFPEAYDGMTLADVMNRVAHDHTKMLLETMPEEKSKLAREGLAYVRNLNGHEYTPEEKEIQDELEAKDRTSGELFDAVRDFAAIELYEKECECTCYQFARDMDLSFISEPQLCGDIQGELLAQARKIQKKDDWTSERIQDRIMDTFAEQVAGFDRQIFHKKVNGTRLFDSKEFNTIKDDLEKLQKDLTKGNGIRNLKNIKYSLETVSQHCQDYLDKNPGTRIHERGNTRKRIVNELKAAIDAQIGELDKNFGQKFKETDKEWVKVDKIETADKVKLKISYDDLSGNKKNSVNKVLKNSNPTMENPQKAPKI